MLGVHPGGGGGEGGLMVRFDRSKASPLTSRSFEQNQQMADLRWYLVPETGIEVDDHFHYPKTRRIEIKKRKGNSPSLINASSFALY